MAGRHDQWRDHTHAIGNALADAAPEGWRRVELYSRATVDVQDYVATVVMPDSTELTLDVPDEVPGEVLAIRDAFYQEGEGTWFSFRYLLDAPGKVQSLYDVDWDPGLDGDPGMWARDLAAYPRDPEHLPAWLRAELAAAGVVVPPGDLPLTEEQSWQRLTMRILFAAPVNSSEIAFSWTAGDPNPPFASVRPVSDLARPGFELPSDVPDLLTAVRALTHRPGCGAWREVRATIGQNAVADWYYTYEPFFGYPIAIDPADPIGSARQAAVDLEIPEERYRVGETADGAWCLVADGDRWVVLRGRDRSTFATAAEAAEDFVRRVYREHAVFGSTVPADAKRLTGEWPIQPVGGDAPLQMYGGKHLEILPPGTELDRYGDPAGNTLYVGGTGWPERSEPDEVADMALHRYRLRKPVRAITGKAIAWYDQPGGGTAHVLEHPVAHYLETGALEEL